MKEFKKNIKWIVLFLLVTAVSFTVIALRKNITHEAKTAKIVQNGKVIQTVDLESVTEPYEFTVTADNGGENTIRVERGRIAVIHASCPDKICVNRGFIDNPLFPIVCLPNKLSVVITDENNDIDAVAGGDAQ